ncbi:D-alanine--D-alanine ligase [Streptomyces sp. NPDC059835]|uniref:D-alanine--D-alanine ligase family protein n=1 Tax=Streptomyces sp. NPDC059835 TaxID=3346967 RepID=UPI003659D435
MNQQQPGLVAVVSGGRSAERDRSLLSGNTALESLNRQGYRTVFLDAADPDFIDRIRTSDVAFLAIAGQYAEDGKLQGLLETLGVPYTGSGVMTSAIGMNKTMAKNVVAAAGVSVLPQALIPAQGESDAVAKAIADSIAFPAILKPQSEGGSVGMTVCHEIGELVETISAVDRSGTWLVEPFVTGTAVTAAVLESDGNHLVLPVLETLPTEAEFYDYATKRDKNLHRYRCPAELPEEITQQISAAALTAHQALGCTGYSRSDFMVSDDGAVVWLEANTLPGLSRSGNLATMAEAAGIDYDQLIRMILATADRTKGYRS